MAHLLGFTSRSTIGQYTSSSKIKRFRHRDREEYKHEKSNVFLGKRSLRQKIKSASYKKICPKDIKTI